MSQNDDARLLKEAVHGNEPAFLELYRRHHPAVFRFAVHMCGSTSAAEDITQEVFVFLIETPGSFDPKRGSLAAFLLGIARNLSLRHLRKESGISELPEASMSLQSPLSDLLHGERLERMRKAILSLPAAYREVILLCELSELSYEEAASVLGCAVGTVRSRLHRARNLLLRKLGLPAPAEKPEQGGTEYGLPVF
jgi:RNA polymerase sigma-70 factor, ECF subfamily